MKQLRIYTFLSLFLLTAYVHAIHVKLDWDPTQNTFFGTDTVTLLSFKDAQYGAFKGLPSYVFQKELVGNQPNLKVEAIISNPVYESISPSETIEGTELLSDQVQTKTGITTVSKKDLLDIYVLPVRKSGTDIQILKEFDLTYTTTATPSLKSVSNTSSATAFVSESVLSSGKWIKLTVTEPGLYRLTYNEIQDMGLDPSTVNIYGNGGYTLNRIFNNRRFDDLTQNALYVSKGSDGVFGSGDFVLFYFNGLTEWTYDETNHKYIHATHPFADEAHYFVTSGRGPTKEVNTLSEVNGTAQNTVTSFDENQVEEPRLVNLIESGDDWYSQEMYTGNSASFSFNFDNINTLENVSCESLVLSRSMEQNANWYLKNNGTTLGSASINNTTNSITGIYAKTQTILSSFKPASESFTLNLEYSSSESSAIGWYQYLRVTARRNLQRNGSPLYFKDAISFKQGGLSEFSIGNSDEELIIMDVSDWTEPAIIPSRFSGATTTFKTYTDDLKTFVAFKTSDGFKKPKIGETVSNQNLHGLPQQHMVIVAQDYLATEAEELADIHRGEGLEVLVVSPQEIYNEFSGGQADITAIRWFLKMFYDRSTSFDDNIRYLLLFGHGSFDNRADEIGNRLLTYQSDESLDQSETYVSDDYFGLLDNNEGTAGIHDRVDIGVGRLPVNSASQAASVVAKIKHYTQNTNRTAWKNKVLFIGDDGDQNIHMTDANNMGDKVLRTYPKMTVNKVLLDAFRMETVSTGASYPDVNRIIEQSVEDGTLLINYSGHGSEVGLAAEQIITMTDIKGYSNLNNLPVWVTATCEFSRYDLVDEQSGGEELVLNAKGGGISLFTTTRLVYSSANFIINNQFFNHAFQKNEAGENNRLGDIFRKTKVAIGTGANKRKFALLGDPALLMCYPTYDAEVTHINNIPITDDLDTLKALSDVTISGVIKDESGVLQTDFNGRIFPTIYDKIVTKKTLANKGGNTMSFDLWENILFSGIDSVRNGAFSFSFKVPKDINYEEGFGRVSLYAESQSAEANGYFEGVTVGGFNDNHASDEEGPNLTMFLNAPSFKDGDRVNTSPLLIANLEDVSGINTTGNSIGHDIILMLNDDPNTMLIINDYYEAEIGEYTKGSIQYRLSDLDEGEHTLMLRVWDNFNNSITKTISFTVDNDIKPEIHDVIAYPNPTNGEVKFRLTHDRPDDVLTISIDIFDTKGQIISRLSEQTYSSGDETDPIVWDLKTPSGQKVSSGIYLYRIKMENSGKISIGATQKLLVR